MIFFPRLFAAQPMTSRCDMRGRPINTVSSVAVLVEKSSRQRVSATRRIPQSHYVVAEGHVGH